MAAQQAGRGVQSITVGGRLLDGLVRAEGPLMLRELAERAGLTAGQAHAYLVSFRALGLVEQDPATGLYRLGPYALTLGLARLRRHDPLAVIWEAVPAFADAVQLMVTMSIWTDAGPVPDLFQYPHGRALLLDPNGHWPPVCGVNATESHSTFSRGGTACGAQGWRGRVGRKKGLCGCDCAHSYAGMLANRGQPRAGHQCYCGAGV
jgi:IclR helix-turn-helix domain